MRVQFGKAEFASGNKINGLNKQGLFINIEQSPENVLHSKIFSPFQNAKTLMFLCYCVMRKFGETPGYHLVRGF